MLVTEEIIMDLIVNSGNASSLAIEAIHAARYGDFAAADHKLQESSEASVKAHNIQAELIRADLEEGKRIEINLLLVHAQDHLMNALTIKTLAGELIEILRANAKTKEEEIKG